MLSQIVRPMVSTQINLLARSKSTRSTLIKTIAKWLSFLGVEATVNQIDALGDKIEVSITVGKPDTSENSDWQKILQNLNRSTSQTEELVNDSVSIPPEQETKYQRILAYAVQRSHSESSVNWDKIYPQLQRLGLEESTLLGIKSALKVPQYIDTLVKDLDADVAALALSQTVSIALLDRQINPQEYQTLQTLVETIADNCH
ncbi:MAG: hypothetical protein WBF90_14340 [Rivularia sp. (in: cyanobacteria)]|jgi:hypothetical protein